MWVFWILAKLLIVQQDWVPSNSGYSVSMMQISHAMKTPEVTVVGYTLNHVTSHNQWLLFAIAL